MNKKDKKMESYADIVGNYHVCGRDGIIENIPCLECIEYYENKTNKAR